MGDVEQQRRKREREAQMKLDIERAERRVREERERQEQKREHERRRLQLKAIKAQHERKEADIAEGQIRSKQLTEEMEQKKWNDQLAKENQDI